MRAQPPFMYFIFNILYIISWRSSTAGVLFDERWNSLTQTGLPVAKAPAEDSLVSQGPKLGYRKRLDTVVVPTTNFADWPCGTSRLRLGGGAGPRRKHSLRVTWRVCPQE